MRILMVIPQKFYSTRGTPLSAYHRTRELVALGHSVDILTYDPGESSQPRRHGLPRRWLHFANEIPPGRRGSRSGSTRCCSATCSGVSSGRC
jgi:hypothetical protein